MSAITHYVASQRCRPVYGAFARASDFKGASIKPFMVMSPVLSVMELFLAFVLGCQYGTVAAMLSKALRLFLPKLHSPYSGDW